MSGIKDYADDKKFKSEAVIFLKQNLEDLIMLRKETIIELNELDTIINELINDIRSLGIDIDITYIE